MVVDAVIAHLEETCTFDSDDFAAFRAALAENHSPREENFTAGIERLMEFEIAAIDFAVKMLEALKKCRFALNSVGWVFKINVFAVKRCQFGGVTRGEAAIGALERVGQIGITVAYRWACLWRKGCVLFCVLRYFHGVDEL